MPSATLSRGNANASRACPCGRTWRRREPRRRQALRRNEGRLRHPGEGRGPWCRPRSATDMDSGFRRNDATEGFRRNDATESAGVSASGCAGRMRHCRRALGPRRALPYYPSMPLLSAARPLADIGHRLTVQSEFQPAGDQPQAIAELSEGIAKGERDQVLLGVTGSGKTFTIAHVIERAQRPAIVLAPNKTLAAQLYGEMKSFFPENSVEYFVS